MLTWSLVSLCLPRFLLPLSHHSLIDLFHYGHVEFIKKARSFGNYLIVGLCSDEECTSYKRRPVLSIEERTRSVQGCRYVDEVLPNCPLRVTKEFMDEHKIDFVAHGDDFDKEKIKYWYGAGEFHRLFIPFPSPSPSFLPHSKLATVTLLISMRSLPSHRARQIPSSPLHSRGFHHRSSKSHSRAIRSRLS
jgi:cytidyltransferase-like protein